MRTRRILLTILVVGLGISSLRAQIVDPALERFKKDRAALNAYSRKKVGEWKGCSVTAALMLPTMIAGVKAMRTDGLPGDLPATFVDAVASVTKGDEMGRKDGFNMEMGGATPK